MNISEARLKIHRQILDVLVSLALDDTTSDQEVADLEEDMAEVAELIMENIGLEIQSVDDESIVQATLNVATPEDN
jgi:hypothetical protein